MFFFCIHENSPNNCDNIRYNFRQVVFFCVGSVLSLDFDWHQKVSEPIREFVHLLFDEVVICLILYCILLLLRCCLNWHSTLMHWFSKVLFHLLKNKKIQGKKKKKCDHLQQRKFWKNVHFQSQCCNPATLIQLHHRSHVGWLTLSDVRVS